jgi:hypothetical protein
VTLSPAKFPVGKLLGLVGAALCDAFGLGVALPLGAVESAGAGVVGFDEVETWVNCGG